MTALLLVMMGTSGCYLSHLATGQLRLLRAREPLESVLADPDTSPILRERLELVQEARSFATDLGLDVGGQYTAYVAWPGDRIVTTVVAARPGEVEPAGFWFPILGTLPYKGFFDPERAEAEATRLREKGLDVCVVGVPAYSTLGWMDDPVTAPMLRGEEGDLVETIVHELVHATVYLPDDADFSEGVAAFIGEEARVRFYGSKRDGEQERRQRNRVEDSRRLDAEILALRDRVAELYATQPAGVQRQSDRLRLEREARDAIAALPLATRDTVATAETLLLNDACLALVGTYSADLEAYVARLVSEGGDLRAFIGRLRVAADAPDPRVALFAP